MENNNIYFLYRHLSKKDNRPFYIGIGKKRTSYKTYKTEFYRAYNKKNRNKHWENIANKYGYNVEILFESDSQDLIKSKEIEFITLYGRKDLNTGILVNWCNGGGLNNPSKEVRDKMSKSALERYKRNDNVKLSKGPTQKNIENRIKSVFCASKDGTYSNTFKSIKEASLFTKVDFRNINLICKNKRKWGNNYTFSYTNEKTNPADLKQ